MVKKNNNLFLLDSRRVKLIRKSGKRMSKTTKKYKANHKEKLESSNRIRGWDEKKQNKKNSFDKKKF